MQTVPVQCRTQASAVRNYRCARRRKRNDQVQYHRLLPRCESTRPLHHHVCECSKRCCTSTALALRWRGNERQLTENVEEEQEPFKERKLSPILVFGNTIIHVPFSWKGPLESSNARTALFLFVPVCHTKIGLYVVGVMFFLCLLAWLERYWP